MGCRPFLVSMWKHWIISRNHYVATSFIILVPIIFASTTIGLHYLWRMTYVFGDKSKENVSIVFEIDRHLADHSVKILFSPNTTDVWSFMSEAFDPEQNELQGYESEKSIEIFSRTESSNLLWREKRWAAVIFSYMSLNATPAILNYKLRFPGQANLDNSKLNGAYYNSPVRFRFESIEHFDASMELFTWMQLKIDNTFIGLQQRKTSTSKKHVISTQKMPVPKARSLQGEFSMIIILPVVIVCEFVLISPLIAIRILDEKNIGAKELMKIMGMSNVKYWGSNFAYYYLIMAINSAIITGMLSTPFQYNTAVLQDTSPSLYFVAMLLYYAESLIFCFIITIVFNKASSAVLALMTIEIACLAISYLTSYEQSLLTKILTCMLPNISLYWVLFIMDREQIFAFGSQWSTILTPVYGSTDSFCMGIVLGEMLISCVLYSILLLYLDAVWPWQAGIPKSPLFCFPQLCPSSEELDTDPTFGSQANLIHMEKEPLYLEPSIVISHLTKVFKMGKKNIKAVDDLCLNIYPGQITAFLGHNGAGKTTVMNMLTGTFLPTSGTAHINGHNIVSETEAARKSLALCPQHNVLYDDFTVEEHLKLFAGLKGMSGCNMKKEVKKLMTQFDLDNVKNIKSKDLSGGMKRKLSLGNAIIGGPKVLILDEPTTGLDPESRHAIWKIIQRLRSECTILLTTHYMEEADVLGDRIIIIGEGTLQCCGSPIYLKREFGDGYHLCIEKGRNCQVDKITDIILHYVSDGKLLKDTQQELVYSLSSETRQFSRLFKVIERFSEYLGILSYNITITTMDDVFMKIGEGNKKQFQTDSGDMFSIEQSYNREISNKEYCMNHRPRLLQQMKALFFKRFHYSKCQMPLLILQVIISITAVVLFIYLRFVSKNDELIPEFKYDLNTMFYDTKYGFYELNREKAKNVIPLTKYYAELLKKENVKVDLTYDAKTYLLDKENEGRYQYLRKYVIGSSFIDNDKMLSINAWYNAIHYHLRTISINLAANAFLQYISNDTSSKIHITSQKFPNSNSRMSQAKTETFRMINHFINTMILSFGLSFLPATFILFPIYERVSKTKLLQIMCGINGSIHCLINIFWDYLIYIFCSLLMLIPFFIYHGYKHFIALDSVGAVFIFLALHGLSSLSFTYILSYILKSPSVGFITAVILNCFFGCIFVPVMFLWKWAEPFSRVTDTVFWIMRLLPHFSLTLGMYNIHNLGVVNIKCFHLPKSDYRKECIVGLFKAKPFCCSGPSCNETDLQRPPYLAFLDEAAGKECVALAISAILYFFIIFLLEQHPYKILRTSRNKSKTENTSEDFSNSCPISILKSNHFTEVISECQRVKNILDLDTVNNEALLVSNLTKYFGSLAAVKELTFGIHQEECFGLLGVNGAGKSTLFKILAGDLLRTSGNAFINNSSLQQNIHEFQMSIGYCPQSDSFINGLSGRQTLEMFANLRGIANTAIQQNVNKLLLMCGLDKEADKPAYSYSGGTKRKLSLAVALIGAPPVVLMDEPSAGVDPLSRHMLWKTIRTMKHLSRMSFILNSHSMAECEALCDRIAILSKGQFHYIGTVQRLKAKYGQGYNLIIKVCSADDVTFIRTKSVMSYIQNFFPSAVLKLEYLGTLYYEITDVSMKFSYMFSIMEKAKTKFQLEDYLLSDYPIEEVFYSMSNKNNDYLSTVEIAML